MSPGASTAACGLIDAAPGSVDVLEGLLDSAPVGLAYLDTDFRFRRVNDALAGMNELTVAAHLGRRVSDVRPACWSQLEETFRSVLLTGEPAAIKDVVGDGVALPAGRWLNSVYPVRVDGEIVGLGWLLVDISAALRADELHTAITATMLEGLYALDVDGKMTFVNTAASEMLGWREEELLGRDAHETIHFQDPDGGLLAARDSPLRGVRTEGSTVDGAEGTFTRRDGTTFPVTYSAAPLANAEHGRGVVVVFRDATQERASQVRAQRELDALHWLGRTRDAIDEDRLVLYSQPIVPLAGGKPSEELLLRMISRDGEVISAGSFLPVAEQYGLITEIDRWVVSEAAKVAACGRTVEVNLSTKSMDPAMLRHIDTELRDAGADPANVIIEMTETALMADTSAGERFARGLAGIGCGLALDDFGTGFASLAYLKILPVQYLKIDIGFVHDLPTNETNQHLVQAIVSLARGFGQRTIAEGVEDEETLELLRTYGVDFAQGYHLGVPKPFECG